MARGYPDFFGNPVFPSYGGAQEVEGGGAVLANVRQSLVTVLGKGSLYHIQLLASGFTTVQDDDFFFSFDGVEYYSNSFRNLLLEGPIVPMLGGPSISLYSTEINRFCIWFSGQISYTLSMMIEYDENGGNIPNVQYRIRYTSIV